MSAVIKQIIVLHTFCAFTLLAVNRAITRSSAVIARFFSPIRRSTNLFDLSLSLYSSNNDFFL